MVEGIYSRGGYLGKERKPKKCRRIDKGVWTRGSSSETRSGRGRGIQKNGATGKVYSEVVVRVGWSEVQGRIFK